MSIDFDEAVAERLTRALRDADDLLRGQGWDRLKAREDALEEFRGAYAELFREACLAETEDRARLANALDDLADQVQKATYRARAERDRVAELAAWQIREDERQARRVAEPPGLPLHGYEIFDRRPDDPPLSPPVLTLSFKVYGRTRTVSRISFVGSTSADPERLRWWAKRSGYRNRDAREEWLTVKHSFDRFRAQCSWAECGGVSIFDGYEDYLFECENDVRWIGRVADEFEEAGSGSIPDYKLVLGAAVTPSEVAPLLLDTELTAGQVAIAWQELEANSNIDTNALLRRYADRFGRLDGLPALARVRANRYRVPALLKTAQRELAQVRSGELDGGADRAKQLRDEIAYLEHALLPVGEGGVQLYLYDRDASRIVEMFGTPGPDTVREVTYVPGTFTGLDSFYTGEVQQIARHLTSNLPGTVAFVYKDGVFPGEKDTAGDPNMLRIGEANDQDLTRKTGARLAQFERGMRLDPALRDAQSIGIGHSWGLANLTSSEVAGAEYDTVISLSGAGMLPDWKANPATGYFDLSYNDILQAAQRDGRVWEGNFPRNNRGFTSLPYYEGPEDHKLRGKSVFDVGDVLGVALENHSLIAKDVPANRDALEDLRSLVKS